MLEFWKVGLAHIGGLDVPLFLLFLLSVSSFLRYALSALVSVLFIVS